MEDRLKQIEKTLESNNQTLQRIETALVGDNFNNHKGIVSQLEEVKKDIEKLNSFKSEIMIYFNQIKWAIGIITTIFTGLILYLFKKIV